MKTCALTKYEDDSKEVDEVEKKKVEPFQLYISNDSFI